MPRRHVRRLVVLLAVLVGVGALAFAGAPALGMWLVIDDPLVPSDAIFVLDGRTPSREVEAAALYQRRLAPIVGISHPRDAQEVARRLARLPSPQDTAQAALVALGVPGRAVLRLQPEAQNTVEELAVIADAAAARGFHRLIIVTSPSHTRRVRTIWDARHRAAAVAVIHPTAYETFDARRWWRSRHGVEEVVHELGGILNFRLGSLLPTYDDPR
jgi:uncharacterized SAM-binding protein YcdF (DUF218 family)